MKIETFDDDLLGLRDFAQRLERFIAIEHQYVDGSLVIGLSSKFGSGKTTFLQMWDDSIQKATNKEEAPLTISLNAWESDYYGDPLFAIISGLIDSIQKEGQSPEKLINAAKDFGWFTAAMANQIANKLTGIDPIAAGEQAEKKKSKREEKIILPPDTFSIYEGRKNAMGALKKAIKEFVESASPRVLFLVDELDRCRPDYAIKYLETIKHIFDVKGAVFILAADRQQLENSAKTAFGADLDFEEYYRKFIHREVTLPEISEEKYNRIAFKYVKNYLEPESRHCFMKLEQHRIEEISELIGALKLTPRQIQEVFRILGHILETKEENRGRLYWCLGVGSVLMSVLKIGNSKIYHLLGSNQLRPKELFDYLENDLNVKYSDWWFALCLTGNGLKVNKGETAEIIMKSVGLGADDSESNSIVSELGQLYSGWGNRSSSRIHQIYENIEQLYQWK